MKKFPNAIRCETAEESSQLRRLFHEAGLLRRSRDSYLTKTPYDAQDHPLVHFPYRGTWDYAKETMDPTTPASVVFEQHALIAPGTSVLVSDDGEKYHGPYRLVGTNSEGEYVVEEARRRYDPYPHIKPAPEGLKEVKALMEKYGLTKNDL